MYTVTRQLQFPDGLEVVEVSQGGLDYANPDMLSPRYPGEGDSYDSPLEAAGTAIEICRAWRQDGHKAAKVAYGATGGMTLPFSPCTFDELRTWAKTRYQQMLDCLQPCNHCGQPIWDPRKAYSVPGLGADRFCREKCAEDAYAAAQVNSEEE